MSTTVSKDAESESEASTCNVAPGVSYSFTPTSARAAGLWQVLANEVPLPMPGASEVADMDAAGSGLDEDDNLCPTFSDGADLPSVGSAKHGSGACRKCCFFPKGRCSNGAECGYCHFAHDERRLKKKNKKKKASNATMELPLQMAPVEYGVIFQIPMLSSQFSSAEVVLTALGVDNSGAKSNQKDLLQEKSRGGEPVQIILETAVPDDKVKQNALDEGFNYAYVPVAVWGYGTY